MSLNFKKWVRGHQIAGANPQRNAAVRKRQYNKCVSGNLKSKPLRDSCERKYGANNNPST